MREPGSYSRNGKGCDGREKLATKSRVMSLELLAGCWWENEHLRPERNSEGQGECCPVCRTVLGPVKHTHCARCSRGDQ